MVKNPYVYGGVFGVVVGSVLALGVFLSEGDSVADQRQAEEETVSVDQYVVPPLSVEVSGNEIIYLEEVVITSHLATNIKHTNSKAVTPAKKWVCSAWRESLVGGRIRECEWK